MKEFRRVEPRVRAVMYEGPDMDPHPEMLDRIKGGGALPWCPKCGEPVTRHARLGHEQVCPGEWLVQDPLFQAGLV